MVTLNFDKNISKNSARSKIKNQPIYRMKHRDRDEKTVELWTTQILTSVSTSSSSNISESTSPSSYH